LLPCIQGLNKLKRACLENAFEPFRSECTPGAFKDTVPTLETIRERMFQMTVYVAVTTTGESVGTLTMALLATEGHLRGMAVQPGWQGKSVAEMLLIYAERDLRATGCVRLTLDTTAPLRRAIGFYQRHGFSFSGKVADFFGMSLYEYSKQLDPQEGELPSD
jgi:GNAT superfamily N-acetyltransferase